MERNYKISISRPCHENWDEMTSNGNGRFCMSCSKTVVDFASMLPEEIQQYIIKNQGSKICGRFKKSQLDSITIQIPNKVLYTQTHFHKMFLLALFIAMGTSLFSCADKEGNKKKIEKIEIVDNVSQSQDKDVSSCYGHQIESKKEKRKIPKERVTMGMVTLSKPIEYYSFKYSIIYNAVDLDILPAPKDGMKKFYSYFAKNYTASKKGEMSVLFVVERDGTLTNFKVTKNASSENETAVIKVLESGPKWIPGKTNNRDVRSTFILPIIFK
ncbi:energy transducer TonB [Flavobacterium sp. SH_e]|uniref:energy transducer TonB n=1 Tax=Flavobacterium TaxID=237 RepID=UPI0021E3BF46|nr:energy transducer TonB [Flavobacterium sp. SH_e]MCV2486132.1 energy transducer TonB [Flavobacterium sp. SH_e]